MKKLISITMTFILVCICSVTAFASEGEYDTAIELYRSWSENMPDYICGVWTTDGGKRNLTFGIQDNDAGNAGKQEILALIKDDSTATFVYQKYNRSYLLQIQNELYAYFQKDLGLLSSGLNEKENRIDLAIYDQKMNDEETKDMIAELTSKYGDAISIGYTDQLNVDLLALGQEPINHQPHYFFFVATISALIFVITFMIFVKKKGMFVMQTNTGNTVVASARLKTKEVEGMVKKSNFKVPADLDSKVMTAIEKNN